LKKIRKIKIRPISEITFHVLELPSNRAKVTLIKLSRISNFWHPRATLLLKYRVAMNYHEATTKLGNMIRPSRQLDDCRAYISNFQHWDVDAGSPYHTLTRAIYFPKNFNLLGKIYEEKGDAQLAIENTEKFLDLWKNADEDLPDLIDAKKRLARLKGVSEK